jgi:hypothetical protein
MSISGPPSRLSGHGRNCLKGNESDIVSDSGHSVRITALGLQWRKLSPIRGCDR